MRNAMKHAGLPAPKFEFTNFFTVTFKKPLTPQVTPQVVLTELEERVLNEIKNNVGISRSQLSKKLGIKPDTAKEYIKKLRDKGVLRRVGKTSGGHWEIVKKRKENEK
jgi:predicted HTH transcriptional regulator